MKIQEYLTATIQNMQILMRHGGRLPRAMAVLIDGPLTIRRFVKYFSTFLTDRIFNDQKVNFALGNRPSSLDTRTMKKN